MKKRSAAISGASTIEALRFEVDALKRVVQAAATERELLVESHAVDAAAHAAKAAAELRATRDAARRRAADDVRRRPAHGLAAGRRRVRPGARPDD